MDGFGEGLDVGLVIGCVLEVEVYWGLVGFDLVLVEVPIGFGV